VDGCAVKNKVEGHERSGIVNPVPGGVDCSKLVSSVLRCVGEGRLLPLITTNRSMYLCEAGLSTLLASVRPPARCQISRIRSPYSSPDPEPNRIRLRRSGVRGVACKLS
jgi:hypothetical protein